MTVTNDELAHFGVKGMKWGVRHDPNRSGTGVGSRRAPLTPEQQQRQAAVQRARAEAGKGKLKESNAFGNSKLAMGMAAVNGLMAASEIAGAVVAFRKGGTIGKGIAVVSGLMAAQTATTTIKDIRNLRAYQKSSDPQRDRLNSLDRKSASIERGRETVSNSIMESPSLAIGKRALAVGLTGAGLAYSVYELRKGHATPGVALKLKKGAAVVSGLMAGVQAASVVRDIKDVHNYNKSRNASRGQ